MYSKLHYISQGETAKEQLANIQSAFDAGCTLVQLRFKRSTYEQLIELAERVKKISTSYGGVFIVNDNVAVAKTVDADGVHLGLTDMAVIQARNILGADKIIGGTANTYTDVQKRIEEKCNYIGLGPFRFTATKERLSPILGLAGYEMIMNQISTNKIEIPIYAIGGIGLEDIELLMRTGVYGVAISSAITNHTNKADLIQNFNLLLYEKVSNC